MDNMKNMKTAYKAMVEEISMEVEEGILTEKDQIQILRAEQPIYENYCNILDWYYDEYTMEEDLNTPLEETYLPEEFSEEEWKQMEKDMADMKAQYEADKAKLVSLTVKEVLTEMKQMQKLFA